MTRCVSCGPFRASYWSGWIDSIAPVEDLSARKGKYSQPHQALDQEKEKAGNPDTCQPCLELLAPAGGGGFRRAVHQMDQFG